MTDLPASVELTLADADRLWNHVADLNARRSSEPHQAEQQVRIAAMAVAALPPHVIAAVHDFRNYGNQHDVLRVRRALPDAASVGPTPNRSPGAPESDEREIAAIGLLAISLLLGEPFTFADLHQGRLVQNVLPLPGQEDTQTSGGSRTFLDWHVEDAFSADRCDYFALLCLRGHPAAQTLTTSVRQLGLAQSTEAVLRERRFAVSPDVAHQSDGHPAVPTAVILGRKDDPEICYDSVYMHPTNPGDTAARAALDDVAAAVQNRALSLVLEPGDLLLVDNRRVVHGRTPFPAAYDGKDRWLLRAMTCSSLCRHRARGACRAIA